MVHVRKGAEKALDEGILYWVAKSEPLLFVQSLSKLKKKLSPPKKFPLKKGKLNILMGSIVSIDYKEAFSHCVNKIYRVVISILQKWEVCPNERL
jgi:hypothetical protein